MVSKTTILFLQLIAVVICHSSFVVYGFNIVVAGGTGKVGQHLSSILANEGHDVTILCRNAFLAASPARASGDFGWLGKGFLEKHPRISLRDWDGGDLLDIVGQDFLGWQEDTLAKADAVVNLVGGYTNQREMAAERIVRESLRVNPTALQLTVSPKAEELKMIAPMTHAPTVLPRLEKCEDYVRLNCANFECMRLEANCIEKECDRIKNAIYDGLK